MSTNADKQTKAEFNVYQQKDQNKDYPMHDAAADKEKHDKTSITFEKKKVDDNKDLQNKDWQNKDLQNKDLHQGKDVQFEHKNIQFEHNKDLNKDINKDKDWNKDLNKDLNKDKDFNKDLHKDKDWNKDLNKEKDFNKDLNKDKDWNKDLHKDKNEGENKGIINTIKEKVKDVLGSGDNDKSKDKEKDVHMENKDLKQDKFVHSAGVGSDKQYVGSAAIGGEKQQFAGATGSSAYSGAGQQTVDHKNLGAEHRELGYEKKPVIASKEKDDAHKVDIHGSLYTSGAGSTYKTNEAK